MPTRDHVFFELTNSVCATFQHDNVYMIKHCPEHGRQKVKIATDIAYYKKTREFLKPGDMPRKFGQGIERGCPYDCGLCSDHEQHSCVSIIELTDRCNLTCPTCYASSSPSHGRHRRLSEIETMLDIIVLSGGEPTLHPDFFTIMDMAKARPIRHLMINTNGLRLAREPDFVARLASYMPGIEVYLQFDSLRAKPLEILRGEDLRHIRQKALDNLNAHGISTTLVVTLAKGLNDEEIGPILDFARTQACVRGVTFQPTQTAGRTEGFDPVTDRLTLTEVRQAILDQTDIFASDDLVPVPCHPDAIMMGYALKLGDEVVPLTRYFSPEDLLSTRNTVNFETVPEVQAKLLQLFSTAHSPQSATDSLASILCCLPQVEVAGLTYANLFRVIVMKFYDAYDFDVRGVKKSCVHIVHQDGRIIPFDTMNLFYRDPSIEAQIKAFGHI